MSDDDFAAAEAAGIHCLSIPTPFAVGRVNCYLIEDEPLTLFDAGPNSGSSLDHLQAALGGHGHAIEDLELIVLTHHHMDHLGLVNILAKHSGADVAAIDVAVPIVENFSEEATREDEFARAMMLRHGIPEEVVDALRTVSEAFRAWGSQAEITRVLHDGDRIELRDRSFTVHHRPGHSVTDTVFHDEQRRMLIAADHLLEHVSSNAMLARPRDGSEGRGQPLVTYLESLEATREMDLELVLPGHGKPITDHRALIDKRFMLHRRRAKKLLRLVQERPRTGYELAQAQWGNIAVTQAYLTLSEVLGHMDLLLNDGSVRERETDGVVRFEAA